MFSNTLVVNSNSDWKQFFILIFIFFYWVFFFFFWYEYTTTYLSVHLLKDSLVGYFEILAIMNKVGIQML